MNRRAFLTVLGGTIAGLAAKPVLALVPANPAVAVLPEPIQWWDIANVMAYQIHAESGMPSRPDYYRQRARTLATKIALVSQARQQAGL